MSALVKLLLFLAVFGVTALFNATLIDIRFDEIRYLLGNIASSDEVSNTFGIVSRYELIKRRMKYGEEDVDNYELEARMQALSSNAQIDSSVQIGKKKFLRIPVRTALNGIRVLLNKPIINPKEEDKIFSVLEIAYFYERVRKYTDAIKSYDEILSTAQLSDDVKSAILVHKAFCFSMISRYDQSKKIYEKVISDYPSTEAGILAWKLIDFLGSMESEREKVKRQNLDEMEKAKQYYLLMDFRNSIKSYSLYIGENREAVTIAEARFYKGRAHEELGETEDALLEYRAVLNIDKSKKWARQANRRMLMLGEFYEQQKGIADEARQKLEQYQDQVFLGNVQKYSSMVAKNSLKSELASSGAGGGISKANDSIMSMIDNVGKLNLTGDAESVNPATGKKHNEEKVTAQGVELSDAEVRELKRRQVLAENPYRRPSALKQGIDEYSGELRYIYNKRLRTGVKLSGKMLVEIRITSGGAISNAKVLQSNMGDQQFEETIVKQIQGWKFKPVPDSLGDVTINYPFEFYEEQ